MVAPQVRNLKKKWKNHDYSTSRNDLGVKKCSMIHLSSSNWFGPLFSSQNWINFENIPKNSNFLKEFDNFCSFFECHSILAEKQQTKQTNYSSLRFSASLDTQDTFQGGIIVERKKFWREISVCLMLFMTESWQNAYLCIAHWRRVSTL